MRWIASVPRALAARVASYVSLGLLCVSAAGCHDNDPVKPGTDVASVEIVSVFIGR